MRRADGTPWINSYAHGRTTYELKWDASAVEAAINRAPASEAAETFVQFALAADLGHDETERLKDLTARLSRVGKRPLDAKLKAARQAYEGRLAQEENVRRLAERKDPRREIDVPQKDDALGPQMILLNDALGKSGEPIPPALDIDGKALRFKLRLFPTMHLLSTDTSNDGADQ